jgi:hypothetical protein
MNCIKCEATDQDRSLNKCPICFRLTCDNCGHRAMGRVFCEKKCADQFFFGDDDDE